MKIINQSYKIISFPDDACKQIEAAGRTCYKSEDKITDFSAAPMVKHFIKSGHHAMIEHAVMTVRFITDRGVSHELVRHRLASYAQESTRYCNYNKDKFDNRITVIRPVFWKEESAVYQNWEAAMAFDEMAYMELIKKGIRAEQARSVLPLSLKTEIVVTTNFREWRHILNLRCSKAAHPQMRSLMLPLLYELYQRIPVLFEDVYEEVLECGN